MQARELEVIPRTTNPVVYMEEKTPQNIKKTFQIRLPTNTGRRVVQQEIVTFILCQLGLSAQSDRIAIPNLFSWTDHASHGRPRRFQSSYMFVG